MDQWTAKSMQLLIDRKDAKPTIALSQGFVARANDLRVYNQYCGFVDALARRYDVSMGNAEELIFSGSRQPWREHVRSLWRPDA